MLLKAGGFKDIPKSVQESKLQMQIETDNVLGWWTENDVQACDAPRVSKNSVYNSYSVWCKSNGMMPLGSVGFWRRVRAIMERSGKKLVESRPWDTVVNPLDGSTERGRVWKCNIDPYGNDDESATDSNVIPLVPTRAAFGQRDKPPAEATPAQLLGPADFNPERDFPI
jgi:phage/plasmid-associated DNA primase